MDDEDIQREEPELELDQETLEQQSQESSRPTTSPSAPTVFETKALTADIIASGISLLARTGNGVSHAYTRLDIKNADISDVQILENYNHLRYLNLSNNKIIDVSSLAALEFLLSVDLSSNQINQVTSILNGRKYLQQANFSKNVIESFTAKEWNLLTFLNLSENKLTELDLDGFKTLVHLDISSNKLSNTRGINIPTLKKLYLAKNSIEKVSDIARLVNLQILHLRDNKVSDLSGFDVGLNELATLNLRSNAIQEFSELDKLTNLVNLKNLTLSDNPISQLANYRLEVVMRLGKLVKLDKDVVTDDERDEAASYKKQQIKEAAENAQRKLEEKEAEEALAREQAEADAELLRQAEAMKKDEEEEVQEGEDN